MCVAESLCFYLFGFSFDNVFRLFEIPLLLEAAHPTHRPRPSRAAAAASGCGEPAPLHRTRGATALLGVESDAPGPVRHR